MWCKSLRNNRNEVTLAWKRNFQRTKDRNLPAGESFCGGSKTPCLPHRRRHQSSVLYNFFQENVKIYSSSSMLLAWKFLQFQNLTTFFIKARYADRVSVRAYDIHKALFHRAWSYTGNRILPSSLRGFHNVILDFRQISLTPALISKDSQ